MLGVAPYLLARLLNISRADALPESRVLPPGWMPRAALPDDRPNDRRHLRRGNIRLVHAGRLAARGRGPGLPRGADAAPRPKFLGDCLRVGLAGVVVGLAAEALRPQYRIGALHILFISGFSFIVLTVAIRVIFGHSGNAHLFEKRLPFFIVASVLIFLATVSRYVADTAPAVRTVHLVAGALFWIAGVAIWMVKVLPKVAVAEPEESNSAG